MTWTWAEIKRLALVQSGMLGLGQVATAAQANIAGDCLNLQLDEWDGEGLSLPDFNHEITFNTVAGQSKYLLGPGMGNAYAIRPETVILATLVIATGPEVRQVMREIPFPGYQAISVPETESQPWNYAINPSYPQMEFWLYPEPSGIYPIHLTCKVKWVDTVGEPSANPFATAEVPSGYANALVSNVALKIAKRYRLTTPDMINDARSTKAMIGQTVGNQNNKMANGGTPQGLFSWNIITAGRNP